VAMAQPGCRLELGLDTGDVQRDVRRIGWHKKQSAANFDALLCERGVYYRIDARERHAGGVWPRPGLLW